MGSKKKMEETKQAITEKLETLQERLQHVGQVARAAEAYLAAHENMLELIVRCQREEEFVRQHQGSLSSFQSPDFRSDWRLAEMMYQGIQENSDTPQKVIMNRLEWFDKQDEEQISGNLQDFHDAFQRGSGRLDDRKAAALLNELETMQRHLDKADTALRDTVYAKILGTLKELSPMGASSG